MTPSDHSPQSDLYDPVPPAEMLVARKVALRLLQAIFQKKHNMDQAVDESADFAALN